MYRIVSRLRPSLLKATTEKMPRRVDNNQESSSLADGNQVVLAMSKQVADSAPISGSAPRRSGVRAVGLP